MVIADVSGRVWSPKINSDGDPDEMMSLRALLKKSFSSRAGWPRRR
jgi:hypothetical protein